MIPIKHHIEPKIDLSNKTYYVTSILEKPYLMMRTDEQNLEGNDRFEGYCKDLADLIAQQLNITIEIHVVKDKKYGGFTLKPDGTKEWNGMMGK